MTTAVQARSYPNLNNLSPQERIELTKLTYAKTSYFQTLFNQDHVEFNCTPFSIAFRQEIERLLIEKNLIEKSYPLEKLHEILNDEMKTYNFDDGVNKISTYFYETDSLFMQVYHQFIHFLRTDFIKEPFWFQAVPTLRIHCPNAKNSNHYPRYHADIAYGHPPEEINLWLPLTDMLEGHSFRTMPLIESKKMLEKYNYDFSAFINDAIHDRNLTLACNTVSNPAPTAFGDVLAFDSRCIHTGEPLLAHTRISMDIRILPLSQYEKMEIEYQGSGRRKILFAPGHCYHEKNSDHFLI
jgi:hypothetical protein